MEMKYTSLAEWLDKIKELREQGQHLLCADDPKLRRLGFVDGDSNLHYIPLTHVQTSRVPPEYRDVLCTVEGRKTLVEGV